MTGEQRFINHETRVNCFTHSRVRAMQFNWPAALGPHPSHLVSQHWESNFVAKCDVANYCVRARAASRQQIVTRLFLASSQLRRPAESECARLIDWPSYLLAARTRQLFRRQCHDSFHTPRLLTNGRPATGSRAQNAPESSQRNQLSAPSLVAGLSPKS